MDKNFFDEDDAEVALLVLDAIKKTASSAAGNDLSPMLMRHALG
jgi:hypothetical protein